MRNAAFFVLRAMKQVKPPHSWARRTSVSAPCSRRAHGAGGAGGCKAAPVAHTPAALSSARCLLIATIMLTTVPQPACPE